MMKNINYKGCFLLKNTRVPSQQQYNYKTFFFFLQQGNVKTDRRVFTLYNDIIYFDRSSDNVIQIRRGR